MSRGRNNRDSTLHSVTIVHPSIFTSEDIDEFEQLLANTSSTEHDVSELFARLPKFLWLGSGAEIRREVVLFSTKKHAVRRVDFFRRTFGQDYWDIVELKSPKREFIRADPRHPRISSAVEAAISQAWDYRDWII